MSDDIVVTIKLPSGASTDQTFDSSDAAAPPPIEEENNIGFSMDAGDPLPPADVDDNSAISDVANQANSTDALPPAYDDSTQADVADEMTDLPQPPEA